MAKLVLVLDVEAEPALWDPHEVIEDILAHADQLPTFTLGMGWFIDGVGGSPAQAGTFVSCEWEPQDLDSAKRDLIKSLTEFRGQLPRGHHDIPGVVRVIELLRSRS